MFSTAAVAVFALIASVAAAPTPLGPGECAPGTGRWQVCNGFAGCCNADVCTLKLSSCPDNPWTPPPVDKTKVDTPAQPPVNSATCPPNRWFVCHNGFQGCCTTADPCTVGWCPPAPVNSATCPPDRWFVCHNGFRGCCTTADPCTVGWCPSAPVSPREEPVTAPVENVRRDDTACLPGTGYFQSCSNGFRGCCTSDVCSKKTPHCANASGPTPIPATNEKIPAPASAVQPQNGICPSGTGYYQVCSNGFKGCCTKDACGLGYCPS